MQFKVNTPPKKQKCARSGAAEKLFECAIAATMAAAAALSVPNAAQASSECLPALIQDRTELDISTVEDLTRLAEISSLTESSRESGAAFGVKIKGIPVGFSQDNVSDLVQSVTSKFRASYSRQARLSFATQSLSRNSVMAYQACIDGMPTTGTQLYAYDATDEYVTVEVRWSAAAFGPQVAEPKITIKNGTPSEPLPAQFTSAESYRMLIAREPGKDVHVKVNSGGTSDSLVVYHRPKVALNLKEKTVSFRSDRPDGRFRLANQGDGRAHAIKDVCFYAPGGWWIAPATVSKNIQVLAGAIDKRTFVEITRNNGKVMCMDAQVYPLAREKGGDLQWLPHMVIQSVDVTIG